MDVDNDEEAPLIIDHEQSMLMKFIDETDDDGDFRRKKLRELVLGNRAHLEDHCVEIPQKKKSDTSWQERSEKKRLNWREQIGKMTAIPTSIPIGINQFNVLQGIDEDGDESGKW